MTPFPPDPEVKALLDELREGIEAALGGDFVGLYLFGSMVYGGFTPGVSDVDLLAVSRRFMTDADVDRLRTMHRGIVERNPAWDGRIEVAYPSLHGLRTFMTQRSPMGIISPGEPIHLIEAGRDWRINWYFVLDHGVTLAGPPPDTIIAPIPRAVFVDAARELGRDMLRRIHTVTGRRAESYAILTTCRALYTHHVGEPVSKQGAAAWVRQRHPEWSGLVDMALERRVSKGADGPVDTLPDTVRFITMAVAELDTAGTGEPPDPSGTA